MDKKKISLCLIFDQHIGDPNKCTLRLIKWVLTPSPFGSRSHPVIFNLQETGPQVERTGPTKSKDTSHFGIHGQTQSACQERAEYQSGACATARRSAATCAAMRGEARPARTTPGRGETSPAEPSSWHGSQARPTLTVSKEMSKSETGASLNFVKATGR